jgi:peptidoglycan hydrolase-like protein with peptidoglycan-binding domain
MTYSLIWLPDVLKNAGLKISLVDGWQTRGRSEMGIVEGVLCHHTATSNPRKLNMPTLRLLIDGRSDLPGPLAQLGLGLDGTFYIIAAGRCNHAGVGYWQGITTGNSSFIGIEAENSGLENDFWSAIQMTAYQHGVAAILKYLGKPANSCAGHKEYALPKGRKPDPSFDMEAFRQEVGKILTGSTQPIKPISSTEPKNKRPTLRRGAIGDHVKDLQKKLKIVIDGDFGRKTEVAVREFQRNHNIVADGIVGPKTWDALDKA